MKLGLLIVLLTSLASLASSSAADYTHPDESKELFKVEKIPLQVHQIKEASHYLTVLALGTQGSSPAERRCTGQLLALALRLDYANQDARLTSHRLRDGIPVQSPEAQDIFKARTQLRILQNWLSLPTSGKNANTLASYLADATRLQDGATKNNPDQADWTGLLPPLLSYEEKAVETPATEPSDTPEPTPEPVIENPYQIAELTTYIPIANEPLYKDDRDPNTPRPAYSRPITYEVKYNISPITINISPNNGPLILTVEGLVEGEQASDKHKELGKAIKALEARLNLSSKNKGAKVSIQLPPENQYSARNSGTIAAAIQMMLSASLTDTALHDRTILCASLNSAGYVKLPPHFWQTIQELRKDEFSRGRLLVPKPAANPLSQFLVFDDPEFFIRWEILSMTTINEAYQLAAKDLEPKMKQTEELFRVIKKRSKGNSVAALTVNRPFRNQLNKILELSPNHLSSRILLLQGGGKRPMRLNRLGQAYAVQPIVQDIQAQLSAMTSSSPDSVILEKLYESSRKDLDAIERVVDGRDNSFYQQAQKIIKDIRSITTLEKRYSRSYSYSTRVKSITLTEALKNNVDQLSTRINSTIRNAAEGN